MIFSKLFDSNAKQLKKLRPIVDEINSLQSKYKDYSKEQIREQTKAWQNELKDKNYEDQQKYLNQILPEAFALVREAATQVLGQTHYEVQLMAGIFMHQGKIAEQKTGEGKTLTATLPLYLNALTGGGAHLVTPNDYLSRHGAGWMGQVYDYLGLQTGVIMQERAFVYDSDYTSSEFNDEYTTHLKEVSRQEAYLADITYGTNHEFGFDYLRDNMARKLSDMVQTNKAGEWGVHHFAIVDEVDSILIDVARTPLIISTSAAQPTERYHTANKIVKQLIKDTDYEVEEKFKNATLTDLGVRRVEQMIGISNLYEQDFEMVHLIEQSLLAHALYEKDTDYVVKDGAVVIVDQFTGRLLPSNRFSHGLHQALESKENVEIQQESRTLAEISYQNYFRMYKKLSGMSATCETEAEEFKKIYDLDVAVVPTNKPVARKDMNDVVYKSEAAKFRAVADEIVEKNKEGQPVLVGTTSVDKSQLLHELLKRRKVKHQILNAKNHEAEAKIIAQAGKKGAVTISTNMAGRGVDIILGGDPSTKEEKTEIKEIGGLHVIGTERHESRRIDNQLRGRAGRQGDPGSSKFFISLQDDLMRIFGGAKVENLMNKFGVDDTVPMEAGLVSKAIENAQKRVEGFNFDRRKQLVDMDDVINVHREVIYKLRRRILEISEGNFEHKDWFISKLNPHIDDELDKKWNDYSENMGEDEWLKAVAQVSLPVVDLLWMEHLVNMAQLRDGIGLRGYAQKDPIVEYKKEGQEKFDILVGKVYTNIIERLSKIQDIGATSNQNYDKSRQENMKKAQYTKGEEEVGVSNEGRQLQQAQRQLKDKTGRTIEFEKVESGKEKVGRNDPCPCGSGKKYKRCHGK